MTDTPDAERLDQIDERIDKARSRAEDAGILVDEHGDQHGDEHDGEQVEEPEEEYADSGATESEDDQTIAPPG